MPWLDRRPDRPGRFRSIKIGPSSLCFPNLSRQAGARRVESEARVDGSVAVIYVKGVLSGLAAIFIASLGPGLLNALKGISEQTATGFGAIAVGFSGAIVTPLFWILAVSSFALFFAASRLGSKVLRVLLFWIPTCLVSAIGFSLFALFTYAWMHFRNG